MLCINKRHSKEYVCIAELLVYYRRMEVRRSDNVLLCNWGAFVCRFACVGVTPKVTNRSFSNLLCGHRGWPKEVVIKFLDKIRIIF